jgi:hypothetical protein
MERIKGPACASALFLWWPVRKRAGFLFVRKETDMAGKRKDNEIPACAGMTQKAGKAPRIIPNKHRRLQIAPTRRKLFGDKAKAEFLEWFAATCNASLSARKVGFHYRTVLRHWREDEAFGARCEAALRMGYVRLEELALRAAEEALSPRARRAPKGDRAPPEEHFRMDPTVALQLLREHGRALAGLAGGSGAWAKPGRPPTRWTFDESIALLDKKLRALGARHGIAPEWDEGDPAPDGAAP